MTAEIDVAHDQIAREHKRLASEAAMPELPDPSLAWEDLSAEDRRALTELLVDKIVIAPHPTKSTTGRRHYIIRAIPCQGHEPEAERLEAVHEARVQIVPQGLTIVRVLPFLLRMTSGLSPQFDRDFRRRRRERTTT